MTGVIWKYHADPDNPLLKDQMGRAGCRVLNPDPDFWQNGFPVWAICGPYVRASLVPGDVLFFVPTAATCRAPRIEESPCTGYLVVRELIADNKTLLADPRFTLRYKDNYKIDLREHLKDDPVRTRVLRPQHIVVGDRHESRWLGREGKALSHAVQEARIANLNVSNRRIRNLSGEEAQALVKILRASCSRR